MEWKEDISGFVGLGIGLGIGLGVVSSVMKTLKEDFPGQKTSKETKPRWRI